MTTQPSTGTEAPVTTGNPMTTKGSNITSEEKPQTTPVQATATTFAIQTTTSPVITQMRTTTGGVQVHTTIKGTLITTISEGPTQTESHTCTETHNSCDGTGYYHFRV